MSAAAPRLDHNHRYLLRWAEAAAARHPEARTLDYGCGRGEVVAEGRARGLSIYGAEVFFEGGDTRPDVEAAGLLGDAVREIHDGRLDFEDESFDLVVANQVFEHVEDLERVLDEIDRVLKPDGSLLALFPSKGVVREGHIGIPMAHWLPPGRVRSAYVRGLRRAGFGYHKGEKSPERWAADALDWLDRFTVYRSKRSAIAPFARRFHVRFVEEDYARFRAQQSAALAAMLPVLRLSVTTPLQRLAIRRLAGMVMVCRKRSGREPASERTHEEGLLVERGEVVGQPLR